MIDGFSYFMGVVSSLFIFLLVGIINAILLVPTIESDHPLTPQKEIKVDSKGDSTITYIYKLEE